MNGYRKFKLLNTKKSQSIDFSDIYSPPQSPKPITKLDPTPLSPPQKLSIPHDPAPAPATIKEDEDGAGKRFGMILSRNCSTTSQRFKADDKQNPSIQSAVKRAFSMRRSTSVSEGYCRIYDHSDPTLCSPIDDDDNGDANFSMQTKFKKKKKGSRILRVCKSLFGM